jgi:hypothetical protein
MTAFAKRIVVRFFNALGLDLRRLRPPRPLATAWPAASPSLYASASSPPPSLTPAYRAKVQTIAHYEALEYEPFALLDLLGSSLKFRGIEMLSATQIHLPQKVRFWRIYIKIKAKGMKLDFTQTGGMSGRQGHI